MVALQRLELLLILLHTLVLGALYSFQLVWSACCREVGSYAISAFAFCAGDLLLSFALYTRCAAEQASSISFLLAYQLHWLDMHAVLFVLCVGLLQVAQSRWLSLKH